MRILVIGCGVSGLTSGLALLRARPNDAVTIWARDVPPETTSNRAAVWYPYLAKPLERVTRWGAISYRAFLDLARDEPAAGVFIQTVWDLRADGWHEPPEWAESIGGVRHAAPAELPPGYADAVTFETPVIDTSVYLAWLRAQFERAGGTIEQRTLASLDEAWAAAPVVVNCAGLGARELVGDTRMTPSRGQVVRVRHNGYRRCMLDETGPNALAYAIPRVNDIILGGTDLQGVESTEPDAAETQRILARCAAIAPDMPAITADDIIEVRCGLRPLRTEVRLEAEWPTPERLLVHNYGHGGAGITLSWGCAAEVAALAHAEA